nr:MAG TPA: CDI toxin-like protein [Caudoviricetes sp.]
MNYDEQHRKHLIDYLQQIERLFYQWVGFSVSLALKTDFQELVTSTLFAFAATKKGKAFDKELARFSNQLDQIIKQGITKEWAFANLKQDHLLREGLTKYQNLEALETFKKRKIKDFTVSNRVWDIAKKAQSEIELALSVSLEEGKSAVQLSREVRNLLNNPTALFRRVRDKYGNLVLSKNAQNYHPGQGVYRSAYKNALRLASNEINVAYKSADWLRIQQNPDVVGFEVRLSPQHKVYDMCDELKGKYPKSFRFHGWHVGCKCHIITILKTDEELIKELKADEELPPESSSNYVDDVPSNYKQWVTDNKDRFKNWKTKPYFIEGNVSAQKNELYITKIAKEYPNGGKINISNLVNTEGSDYERVYQCCDFFAQQGHETTILPRFDSPLKNETYKQLYADLKDTPYWGKCPDFKVGDKFYEHEGHKNSKKGLQNMLSRGLKQSDCIVIDEGDYTIEHLKKLIKFRIKEGKQIREVWMLKENRGLYKIEF